MSNPRERAALALTVGASRIPSESLGAFRAWFPTNEKGFLKREEKTLVWRKDFGSAGTGVVKMYRQRILLAWYREHAFNFRVQHEYEALLVLESSGVPCSAPLFWGFGSAAEHGRFEILITREIVGAVSLKQHFATAAPPLRSEEVLPLFDLLRHMHECGVYHGALWPKNILLATAADGARAFHIIDLARSVCFPANIRGTSMARYDLLSLLYGLPPRCAGFDAEAMLRRYGCAPAEARAIAGQSRRYRSSRHLRNRLALTFQLRALWARIGTSGRRISRAA